MICPKCRERVDPITSDAWLAILDIGTMHEATKREQMIRVLRALRAWDQSAMYFNFEMTETQKAKDKSPYKAPFLRNINTIPGQSIMPTELRDQLYNVLRELGFTDEELRG